MKLALFPLAFFCVAAILGFGSPDRILSQPPGHTDAKARFIQEAPNGWAKFQSGAPRLQGKISIKITAGAEQKLILAGEQEFKQAAGCAFMQTHRLPPDEGKKGRQWELSGANSKYRFNLCRSEESAPWALVTVSTKLISEPQVIPSESVTNWVKGVALAPIAINYNVKDDWPTIIASPNFSLISASPVPDGETTLIKVDFELKWGATETNIIRVVNRGSAWFDPDHCWVMRKCDYTMQRGPKGVVGKHSATYDYEFGADDFPLLKRLTTIDFDANGKISAEQVSELTLTLAHVPEEKFTLTAFGLPEPHGVVWPSRTRWWLWISLGVVGGVGAIFLVQYLRQRFQADPRGSVPVNKDQASCTPPAATA